MSAQLPYLAAPGSVAAALQKIKGASTPEKVTQDFVKTKLQIKGGTGNALVPFFKKIGLVNSDGSPSSLYKAFRGSQVESGKAIAEAMRIGYKPLYEVNEYAHELSDSELKGSIIQITGLEENSNVVILTVSTFKKLKQFANFDALSVDKSQKETAEEPVQGKEEKETVLSQPRMGLNLSYTINLNLPATSDISVFNAIFKSLKENLLK